MSKYADIEQIKKVIRKEWIKYIPMELDMHIAFVLGKIAEVPTIEIVRCKDCKHRYVTGTTTQYYVCDFMDAQFDDNGYCHHGERIESEE